MSFLINDPILDDVAFAALTPSQKKAYFTSIMSQATDSFNEAKHDRAEETSGSAFLWVSLYGKDAISRAFRSFIKANHERRVMNNYRGTKHAWYFGSQTSHGYWDALGAMCDVLTKYKIPCYTCDEWD